MFAIDVIQENENRQLSVKNEKNLIINLYIFLKYPEKLVKSFFWLA